MAPSSASNLDKGVALLRMGKFTESVEFLLDALADTPEDSDLYLYLAFAYSKLDEMEKAISMLEQAATISPASAKIRYNLGVAYHKARNATQAKDEYMVAIALDPTYEAPRQALEALKQIQNEMQQQQQQQGGL